MTEYYYYQETTKDWKADYAVPNHIYILTKDKRDSFGFINANTLVSKIFKKPIPFSPKGRTFKLLKVSKI